MQNQSKHELLSTLMWKLLLTDTVDSFNFFLPQKAMYGMTSTGGYVTQYSRHLERDMARNKTSVGDYYARKAEMLKILMTDNDSGESCTRGELQ